MASRREQRKKKTTTKRLLDAAALPVQGVGAVVDGVQTARERLNGALLPWARRLGWLGMSALVVCAALWIIDEERWPDGLDRDALPYYAVGSLVAASLLGWGCMQVGMRRLRDAVGGRVGRWLFVLAPLVCAVLVLLQAREMIDMSAWQGGEVVEAFARWYPPALVALGLGSYLTRRLGEDQEPGRYERGAWLVVLLAPYAFLLAHVVVRVDVPWLSESLEDTLGEVGTTAIVIQLVLAYFVSSSAAGT